MMPRLLVCLYALVLLACTSHVLAANYASYSDSSDSFEVQSSSSDINSKYSISDKAGALRKTIPRAGFDTDLEIDLNAKSNPESKWFSSVGAVRGTYLDGIAILVAFGIIGVLLVLIWSCTFCWCRCCCCNCCCRKCGKTPRPEGYNRTEKWWPAGTGVFLLLVIIIFVCLGLYYNEEFTRGIAGKTAGDEGVVQLAINLVGDLNSFANQTQNQLQGIAIAAPATVTAISAYLARAGVLAVGTNGLVASLFVVSQQMGGLEVVVPGEAPIGDLTYECDFCKSVSSTISTVATEVKNKADPLFETMNTTINSIDNTLVSVQETIATQVNQSVTAIGTVRTQVSDVKSSMQSTQDNYVQKYDSARRGVGVLILCIPFLWLFQYVLGMIFKKPLFFGLVYVTAWIIGILMFLLLAIHLPLAALTGDSCVYLNKQEGNIDAAFDDPRASALINSCLLDTSMVAALNLTQQLDFANITFPTLPSVDSSFSFTSLDSFAASVSNLSLATFNYSYDPTDDFVRINTITDAAPYYDFWTMTNVSDIVPLKYYNAAVPEQQTTVNISRARIIVQTRAGIILNNTLNSMKANVSGVVTQKTALRASTASFQADFYQIKDALIPLINATNLVIDSLYCGFVGDAYRNIKESYCITTVTSLGGLSLAFFMIAALAQFLAATSILSATRLPPQSEAPKTQIPIASPVDGAGAGSFIPAPSTPMTPMDVASPAGETVALQPMASLDSSPQQQSLEMIPVVASPAGTEEGAIFQYSDPGPAQSPSAVQPY